MMEIGRYANNYDTDADALVLINKGFITSYLELEEFETVHTYRRLSELALTKTEGTFDIKHLIDIHSYIFQDIYYNKEELSETSYVGKLPLRGEFRMENIAKDNHQFANALFIERALRYLLEVELKNDNYLKDLPFDTFIKKISYYLAEINACHPFREGNGRSGREFIRQLSLYSGYVIDWGLLYKNEDETSPNDSVDETLQENQKNEFLDAMKLSVKDTSKLEDIMTEITRKK